MNLILKDDKKLLILPALISFILTLLLLYKYTFPISWDVYYHIHMIDLYMNRGLVFWDYLTVAPKGRLIMYPPLFHLIFAAITKTFNTSPVELCRIAQPFFSFYLIGTITYVSYKLTNTRTALITAFLSMFTFITFNRSVICTPATIAMGLFMISCLFFYESIEKKSTKYIILSALALALIWNLHMATALLTTGVIGLYGLIQLVQRKITIKTVLIYILTVFLVGMPWWIYIATNYSLVFNSIAGNNLLITDFFFRYYGIIPTILLLTGYYALIKEKSTKTVFLLVWTISLILLSQINYLGFNTVSIRILEVVSYPLILISGIGLTYIYDKYIQNTKQKNILVILIVILSVSSALLYVDSYTPDVLADNDVNNTVISENIHAIVNPVTTTFKPTVIASRFANTTLAHQRYDIMNWFKKENSNEITVSEDAIMDTIIVSTSQTPVIYGGFTESIPEYVTDPVHIIKGWSNSEELHQLQIGYLLLKHDTPIPYYADMIYENEYYKICRIKEKYR